MGPFAFHIYLVANHLTRFMRLPALCGLTSVRGLYAFDASLS